MAAAPKRESPARPGQLVEWLSGRGSTCTRGCRRRERHVPSPGARSSRRRLLEVAELAALILRVRGAGCVRSFATSTSEVSISRHAAMRLTSLQAMSPAAMIIGSRTTSVGRGRARRAARVGGGHHHPQRVALVVVVDVVGANGPRRCPRTPRRCCRSAASGGRRRPGRPSTCPSSRSAAPRSGRGPRSPARRARRRRDRRVLDDERRPGGRPRSRLASSVVSEAPARPGRRTRCR